MGSPGGFWAPAPRAATSSRLERLRPGPYHPDVSDWMRPAEGGLWHRYSLLQEADPIELGGITFLCGDFLGRSGRVDDRRAGMGA
jgi:hypothetical protein